MTSRWNWRYLITYLNIPKLEVLVPCFGSKNYSCMLWTIIYIDLHVWSRFAKCDSRPWLQLARSKAKFRQVDKVFIVRKEKNTCGSPVPVCNLGSASHHVTGCCDFQTSMSNSLTANGHSNIVSDWFSVVLLASRRQWQKITIWGWQTP